MIKPVENQFLKCVVFCNGVASCEILSLVTVTSPALSMKRMQSVFIKYVWVKGKKEGRWSGMPASSTLLCLPIISHIHSTSIYWLPTACHLDAQGVTVNNTDHVSTLGKLTFSLGEEQVKITT